MIEFALCYLALSFAVGVVSIPGFVFGWRLCANELWRTLMLFCPLSWCVLVASLVVYGFYKGRAVRKGVA